MNNEDVHFYRSAYENKIGLSNKMGRFVWSVIYVVLFRPTPRMCYGWRRFLLRCFRAKISPSTLVFPNVQIWAPWNLEMHARSVMGERVNCYNVDKVIFEADTSAAGFNVLCTASHDVHSDARELVHAPIRLSRGSWLFFHSFISPGVTIGAGAIVAAGAVVTKDVDSYTIVGGNPAKYIKKRDIEPR